MAGALVEVTREDAVLICEVLGYEDASSWDRVKLEDCLAEIAQMVEDEELDLKKLLSEEDYSRLGPLVERLVSGGEIRVVEKPSDVGGGVSSKRVSKKDVRRTGKAGQRGASRRGEKSRLQCVADAYRELGESFSKEDLIARADELYRESGGRSSYRETVLTVNRFLSVLKVLGLLKSQRVELYERKD